VMLAICLAGYYEREPRVFVDISPTPFHWYRFGKVFLGVTHGHMAKPEKLPGIMATDRPIDWGETLHKGLDYRAPSPRHPARVPGLQGPHDPHAGGARRLAQRKRLPRRS
jgi:hypothetical protein